MFETTPFRAAGAALALGAALAPADAVFEIGSVTKVFTAAVLADMAARGEVRRDVRLLEPGDGAPGPRAGPARRGELRGDFDAVRRVGVVVRRRVPVGPDVSHRGHPGGGRAVHPGHRERRRSESNRRIEVLQ